jgi:hypothetical protein
MRTHSLRDVKQILNLSLSIDNRKNSIERLVVADTPESLRRSSGHGLCSMVNSLQLKVL